MSDDQQRGIEGQNRTVMDSHPTLTTVTLQTEGVRHVLPYALNCTAVRFYAKVTRRP